MGLIERWRERAANRRKINNEMRRRTTRVVALTLDGIALTEMACAADLESACTPRPPKVEYFEKWDSWWVKTTDGSEHFWRDCKVHPDPDPEFGADNMMVSAWNRYTCRHVDDEVAAIELCIPVRREGPPAMDVGWDVVGG